MSKTRSIHRESAAGLVTARELAGILGLPVSWVYRAVELGRIPVYRLGRYLKFNPQEVLEACREGGGHGPDT